MTDHTHGLYLEHLAQKYALSKEYMYVHCKA